MRLAVVGVGSGGCRAVNRILAVEAKTGRHLCNGNAILIDSKDTDFDTPCRVPEERRLIIGDVHGGVDGTGTDGNPDLGAEIAEEDRHEIVRIFDQIDFMAIDGVLVVAGLGGGTGSGAGAVVVEALQDICDDPVYCLGILPAEDEGTEVALTASRGLPSIVKAADNTLLFDNESWHSGAGDYAEANIALAKRTVTLFAAGEFDAGAAPENRMDPSDVMRTLATGGISSIGYAATDVTTGWRAWWARVKATFVRDERRDEPATAAARINNLVRRAAKSRLTLPCEIDSAERALILLSGPPRELSRKGFESGRYWLEQEADTVDVKAGDEPHVAAAELTAVVLYANVTDVPRIDEMQAQAKGAELTDASTDTEDGTSEEFVFENQRTF